MRLAHLIFKNVTNITKISRRLSSSSPILTPYYDVNFIENQYFKVGRIEGKGRGLIASKDIQSNIILFFEKPIVSFRNLAFHSEMLDEYCPNCFHKISLSSRVSSHEYCSKECKDAALNEYKKLSDKLNLDQILEYCARSEKKFILIIVRMVAISLLSGKNFQNYWKKINNLCYAGIPDINDIPSEWIKEYKMLKDAYTKVLDEESGGKIFKVLNMEWYTRLIGTLHLNMMSINPDIGIGCSSSILFFNGSLLNHSCNPNVDVGWIAFDSHGSDANMLQDMLSINHNANRNDNDSSNNATNEIFDTIELEKAFHSNNVGYFKTNRKIIKGEELTISYVDTTKECDEKKSELLFAYNIECIECDDNNGLI
jgi:hypothetical protein